ncbi:MAG: isoleucine-tRNA ligase [Geoglossum umbratile]|nr:MAG: isoleucine-tRNA ligase [Geoglossum umbratile]
MPNPSPVLCASWSSTLRLPKSTFPPRISALDRAALLKRCTDDLYSWQRQHRPSHDTFVLHDGPPYANGNLHIGHALNKILKDIICRFQLTQGKRVSFVPGWDCHGLPIELKALQQKQQQQQQQQQREPGSVAPTNGTHLRVDAVTVRDIARELANKTVEEQKRGFKGWGVMGDWDGAWKTMDRKFETRQLGVFRRMVGKGLIYRRHKPVYWSPSSGTALAEAELEYRVDHESTAAFIKFPVTGIPSHLANRPGVDLARLHAVVWTTTPWTLPANKAIALQENLTYSIVELQDGCQLLVGESRIHQLSKMFLGDMVKVIVKTIPGTALIGTANYVNVFQGRTSAAQGFIHAEFVSADSGSGLVHCAPGHGMEDYDVCTKLGIEVFAPVDEHGCFTRAALTEDPGLLEGKSVLNEGTRLILDYLKDKGHVLHVHKYTHKYPYDWRSKLPTIIRATEQWFADVGCIKDAALKSLEGVRFIPDSGRLRLESFVKGRSEWCISRQRAWGVPIPALFHKASGAAVLTEESVAHITSVIEKRGIDSWWTDERDDSAWIPPHLLDASGECMYERGKDTMDVWFDSGTSWTMLNGPQLQEGAAVSDVYIEGTDQHRGWFQSSLLTYIACQSTSKLPGPTLTAPFKTLITHGFTLDQDGRKMSKSLGNVIDPSEITNGTLLQPVHKKSNKTRGVGGSEPVYDGLGPDALRIWVAGCDYTSDIAIGKPVLKAVNASLHKLRVTVKLLLGALQDWDPRDIVEYGNLSQVDRIALLQLLAVNRAVLEAYKSHEFYRVVNTINRWVNMDISAFYIETVKDRLYADGLRSRSRRAAQTVLFQIYINLLGMLGPVTPLLVEEAWHHAPAAIKDNIQHPLQQPYPPIREEWDDKLLAADLPLLLRANNAVKLAQELARNEKKLGSSLQSSVHLVINSSAAYRLFQRYLAELESIFVVSSVSLHRPPMDQNIITNAEWSYSAEFEIAEGDKAKVYVLSPTAAKCVRCWRYNVHTPADTKELLCGRCTDVMAELSGAAGASSKHLEQAAA